MLKLILKYFTQWINFLNLLYSINYIYINYILYKIKSILLYIIKNNKITLFNFYNRFIYIIYFNINLLFLLYL